MITDVWVNEATYPDGDALNAAWGQRFKLAGEVIHTKSQYQEIYIFDSKMHGRVMLLDGAVQVTEKDEFAYHKMLTHVPMISHGGVENVLIVGGGDGGALRRILAYPSVQKVSVVEIDEAVVDLSRRYLRNICGDAWDDPRTHLILADAADYIASDGCPDEKYDLIIVDGPDPIGAGESLFQSSFFSGLPNVLNEHGIVAMQSGVPFMVPEQLKGVANSFRESFQFVSIFVVSVPTYIGGQMAIVAASQHKDLKSVSLEEVESTLASYNVDMGARYWSPSVHVASFSVPPYISDCLLT